MTPTGGAAWQQSAPEPWSWCDLPSVILLARGEKLWRDPTALGLRVVVFFKLKIECGYLGHCQLLIFGAYAFGCPSGNVLVFHGGGFSVSRRHLVKVSCAGMPVVSPLLLAVVLLFKLESKILHPALNSDLHGRPRDAGCCPDYKNAAGRSILIFSVD